MKETLSVGRDSTPSFNPSRLTLARERQGLTKQRLAELCNVSRKSVSLWESGEVDNPPVNVLSEVLGFPQSFFYADDAPEVRAEWVSFRALSNMSAGQLARAVASARIAVEFSKWIERHYKTAALDIPTLPDMPPLPPAAMAENTRSAWNLSDRPVVNMLALLERHGIRVFSLPRPDRTVDAFSFYQEGRAYIFLNTGKTPERMRFDLAHELGHLILHREGPKNRSRPVEQEANSFAASLLIAADRLNAQVVGRLKFEDIFQLKAYWRVSAMAMVERLWELKHISDWTRRQWIIELTRRGYRDDEPVGIEPETSKFFSQLFRLTREDGHGLRAVADALNVNPWDIKECVMGLAVASIPGGGDAPESLSPPRTDHLRRVK